MRTAFVASVAVVSIVAGLAVPAMAAEPVLKLIQPGAGFGAGGAAQCTQGFVFRDTAGTWYGSTAAHCVALNERITDRAGTGLGTVVVDDEDENPGGIDFALFRVDPEDIVNINPAVRHWGGPTGVATAATISPGDWVLYNGYPSGFGYCYPLCEAETATAQNSAQAGVGKFESFTGSTARYMGYAVPGYSGGPVLSNDDGRALSLTGGLGFHFNLPHAVGNTLGPSVDAAIARMQTFGFTLTLQTAPFTPFL